MTNNSNLQKAKNTKQDEFYTQLNDIENEMKHYINHFKGKVVLCNCDDPYESNFFKYFAMNFNYLGLKKLISTCYINSPIQGQQLSLLEVEEIENQFGNGKHPYKVEITEVTDENKDGALDLSDVEYLLKNKKNILTPLDGDGDFRSDECIELLKQADIVVTNPPFSLFREYVAQLVKYEKKLLILGSVNAITYKEIFKLIKENQLWLGNNNGHMEFIIPDYYKSRTTGYREENGIKYCSFGNICWFTNLDYAKRHELLTLYKKYNPKEYHYYDNYDAINVNKILDIPLNYEGIIGTPITFLDKYNPEQFEILGIMDRQNSSGLRTKKYTSKDTPKYNDLNARGVIEVNGKLKAMYARIIIKHKGNI